MLSPTSTAPAAPPEEHRQLPHTERYLSVTGAKEHNLKDIDVELPRNQLVVITGLSPVISTEQKTTNRSPRSTQPNGLHRGHQLDLP